MSHRIFVKNLVYALKTQDLKDFFANCGKITNAKVIIDKKTGRSRGFGYVSFEDEQALTEALKLNGQTVEGREIQISKAEPRPEESSASL
jgi:RNA recognition motif-containing protein